MDQWLIVMLNKKKAEGLILAAGYSTRFKLFGSNFKKYLLKLNNSNILGYIITGMVKAGIRKINIIASNISNKSKYKQIILNSVLKSKIDLKNVNLNIIENRAPYRENGYSLFLGLNAISSNYTVLSMADHIFSKNIFSQMIMHYNEYDVFLATDPEYLKDTYKLTDATKVYGLNSFIIDIGKQVSKYNRLDMGTFILRTRVIQEICQEIELDTYKFGVTNVILLAIKSGLNVGYFDFPNVIWVDVDNYSIYNQLKELFNDSSNLHPFGLYTPKHISYEGKRGKEKIKK